MKRYIGRLQLVDRHKNPLGICLRIPIYLLLFFSIWNHYLHFILIGILLEICLWTLIPPVTKTFKFIDEIIQNELLWLKAKIDISKTLSLIFLIGALVIISIGFWIHSFILIGSGFVSMILFNLTMNYIVKKEKRTHNNV